jgi:uncharacterized membrane protein
MNMQRFLQWIDRPERVFLFLGPLFGILLVFLTPPFQVPDEYMHFYRSYQVSEGQWISVRENDRVGGTLPLNLKTAAGLASANLPFHPENKMSLSKLRKGMHVPLEPERRSFYDFLGSAVTPPAAYLPQAVGIALGRWIVARPIALMYGGRLINLAVWLLLMGMALRLTPTGKPLFLLLALMPMSIFQAASLSPDATTNAVCFLFTASVLRLLFDDSVASDRRFLLGMILLTILLTQVKGAYAGLILLLLLVPATRFGSPQRRWIFLGSLTIVAIVLWLSWITTIADLYTPYAAYNPQYRDRCALIQGADPGQQIGVVLRSPLRFTVLLARALSEWTVAHSFVAWLGWVDTFFPVWFVRSYFVLLLIASVPAADRRLNLVQWILFGVVVLGSSAVVGLLQYLHWNPVGAGRIVGIQGRYFIPLGPVAFLVAGNIISRLVPARLPPRALNTIASCAAILSLVLTVVMIWRRYYVG